jgi:hypothetical protein
MRVRPIRPPRLAATACLLAAALAAGPAGARDQELDLSEPTIPIRSILSGGPPKDGIPALSSPRFVTADEAVFLDRDDLVVGIEDGGLAKAYPIKILNWHEVVNDRLGARALAVTYCPLTGSAVVFDRLIGAEEVEFGVSGRLYLSNVLMYDRTSNGLWSQLGAAAVSGRFSGTKLETMNSVVTGWAKWRESHPATLVLSTDTGHRRDYGNDPYKYYRSSDSLMFPIGKLDGRLTPKRRVLGLMVEEHARAYDLDELAAYGKPLVETVGGTQVTVSADGGPARADSSTGTVAATELYWFAWAAFHPGTGLWTGPSPEEPTTARLNDIVIDEEEAYWSGALGRPSSLPDSRGAPLGGFYVMSGTLVNRSDLAIHHVRLAFELLDDGGRVVHRQEGYNRGAEAMLELRLEGRAAQAATAAGAQVGPVAVKPIKAGGKDAFRMIFLPSDLPPFAKSRVAVIAVE